jgi:multimeric flavodoxin WrbA
MSIVILDAMEDGNKISDGLKEELQIAGIEYSDFKLKDMNILHCRSCGACSVISPGKCVQKDDSHEIMNAIARCSTFITLTPIRFGGYSSTMKKALDKLMSLCLPFYTVKDGHLLHPARYGTKTMVGIGVYEGTSADQEGCFRKLVENNALNLQYEYRTLILKPSMTMDSIKTEISSLLKEVC